MQEKVGDFLNPNNEKAYNKFSESEKKEMLESLKMVDSTDLYWLDFSDLWESTVESSRWDTVNFREWVVKKDSIWNYIIVNWMKCREYQPWISWFVYKDIKNRYEPEDWLKIWFCDRWIFKKSIRIDSSLGPKKIKIMPEEISKTLWWPFYEVEDINTIKKWPLHNIKWEDIFHTKQTGNEQIESELETTYKQEIIKKNDSETLLNIKWTTFKEHTPWISWFAYKQFNNTNWELDNYLFLGEYKNWKMIWEWIIITPTKKSYIVTSNNQTEE